MFKTNSMKKLSESQYLKVLLCLILCVIFVPDYTFSQKATDKSGLSDLSIRVEYADPLTRSGGIKDIPLLSKTGSADIRITTYRNTLYQVVIHEID